MKWNLTMNCQLIWKRSFCVKICVLLNLSPHLEDNIYPISPISKSSCHVSSIGRGWSLAGTLRHSLWWHQQTNTITGAEEDYPDSTYPNISIQSRDVIDRQPLHALAPRVQGNLLHALCMSRPRQNPSRSARKVILVQPPHSPHYSTGWQKSWMEWHEAHVSAPGPAHCLIYYIRYISKPSQNWHNTGTLICILRQFCDTKITLELYLLGLKFP